MAWTSKVVTSTLAMTAILAVLLGGCAAPADRAPPSNGAGGAPAVPSSMDPSRREPFVPVAPVDHPAMLFGLDADSLAAQQVGGVSPEFSTIWIGRWNLDKGWRDPDAQLARLVAADVTPAIQFYYWGDDIVTACFVDGCKGKDMAGWDQLTVELVAHLNSQLDGRPVLVVLETEFNKGSVARHEPLDGLLAEKAAAIKAGYPAARVVLGIGGWNAPAWPTWDRAAAASDAVGLQALAGSAVESGGAEPSLFNETLAGALYLQRLFGKPIVLHDVAVPSAPAPATVATQMEALSPFLGRLDELKGAGVEAILYRSYVDTPGMPLDSYYGEAERHYGLVDGETGEAKAGGKEWLGGMKEEREGPGIHPPSDLFGLEVPAPLQAGSRAGGVRSRAPSVVPSV